MKEIQMKSDIRLCVDCERILFSDESKFCAFCKRKSKNEDYIKTKKSITELNDPKAIFRPVALALLNDNYGVCKRGFDAMFDLLDNDIIDAVKEIDGRYFISEMAFTELSK